MNAAEATHTIVWQVDPISSELAPYLKHINRGKGGSNVLERVVWAPQPGSQEAFLANPDFECLYEGTRGPGKTDGLIMDFGQFVGRGFGRDWHGVLFRRTFPELDDVINNKVLKWFPQIWPAARYNKQQHTLEWPTGEYLRFRHANDPEDYWKYHGSGIPWIGWEELCTWPDDTLYLRMMSVCRSTNPSIPRRYRSTANPYGPGHNWVKARWQLAGIPDYIVGPLIDSGVEGRRRSIHGTLSENRVLLHSDPHYVERLRASAASPAQLRAWLYGDWDIVAGGMFDDLWSDAAIMLPDLVLKELPRRWRISRSFDWGSSKPFSIGWWARSNGEPITADKRVIGALKGDRVRVAEWYGWTGKPNQGLNLTNDEIARGIVGRETEWGIRERVKRGPADSMIFDPNSGGSGHSIASDMARLGVHWEPADKSSGSRVQGWQQIRRLMWASRQQPREEPGIFACQRCDQFRRIMRTLSRDPKNPDDVSSPEDHIGDEVRYEVRFEPRVPKQGRF